MRVHAVEGHGDAEAYRETCGSREPLLQSVAASEGIGATTALRSRSSDSGGVGRIRAGLAEVVEDGWSANEFSVEGGKGRRTSVQDAKNPRGVCSTDEKSAG